MPEQRVDGLELNWEAECTFEQILLLSRFQCLQKTINECENKSRVYNTEMPLALVSPHLRRLKHCGYTCLFFFLPSSTLFFALNVFKNKESRGGERARGS